MPDDRSAVGRRRLASTSSRRVVALAADAGWVPVNADCTVVAERPRLAPHVDRMADRLSGVLGAPVNVKATRAEGLGALGRAEGIACTAVVLLAGGDDAGRRPPGTGRPDEPDTGRRRTGQAVADARARRAAPGAVRRPRAARPRPPG